MAITITISESPLEKVAGIPDTITLSTNVPATIFYTLDGTEPTLSSLIAIGPITLPTDENTVTLRAFATDGLETSPTITELFGTTTVPLRQAHDKITGLSDNCKTRFPFGSPARAPGVNGIYGNTGGITIDNPLIPSGPTGYDGSGNPTGDTDLDYPEDYSVIFSETDRLGQTGHGIGTLPAGVVFVQPPPDSPPQTTDANSAFFNPKALVVYQDGSEDQYDADVPRLNRAYFDLEDSERVRDGALINPTDPLAPSGSFLRSHWNPRDNTINYYYYDNRAARWIISKEPFQPKPTLVNNLAQILPSRPSGVGLVFKWIPYKYRRLM